jgi:moderate conductance mechanosensitive channel
MTDWIVEFLYIPLTGTALKIVLILVLAFAGYHGLRWVLHQVETRLGRLVAESQRLDRLRTLLQFGRAVAFILIVSIAAMMILSAANINITPLLASAGIAGLALSLGAQTLIRDYIGGILILVENQFFVGNVIKVGEVSGSVERITLRVTHLRDIEGRLHIIPNGDIRLVSNLTAQWARAVVDLNVDFDADVHKVVRALQTAAGQAQADPAIKDYLLEQPEAQGWIGFKDWAVQVRLMARTLPGKQWEVMMALRRHALEALQAEGARLAMPAQRVVYDPVTSPDGRLPE